MKLHFGFAKYQRWSAREATIQEWSPSSRSKPILLCTYGLRRPAMISHAHVHTSAVCCRRPNMPATAFLYWSFMARLRLPKRGRSLPWPRYVKQPTSLALLQLPSEPDFDQNQKGSAGLLLDALIFVPKSEHTASR